MLHFGTFQNPIGIAVDPTGNLVVTDLSNRVFHLNISSGVQTVLAGNGTHEMPPTNISLRYPWGITLDVSGNVYFSDSESHVVRKVNRTTGSMFVMTGNGSPGYGGDGSLATLAKLSKPTGIAIDSSLNIFIADCNNHRVRKIDSQGIITTVAGKGKTTSCDTKTGLATMISLHYPMGIAVDSLGNLYISDSGHSII